MATRVRKPHWPSLEAACLLDVKADQVAQSWVGAVVQFGVGYQGTAIVTREVYILAMIADDDALLYESKLNLIVQLLGICLLRRGFWS